MLFCEYQLANKALKEAMATGMQHSEAFQKYQEDSIMHSNRVHDHGIKLDQIIKIQQERKQARERGRSVAAEGNPRDQPTPIKIDKPQPIKFSCKPRGFATFRKSL